MRLHELAKKHGYNQQDLLTAVQKEGFDVKNTLMVVEADVETWVAKKAEEGWIPPPPEKKALKKKKVVLSATSVIPKPADEPKAESAPETAEPEVEKAPEPAPAAETAAKAVEPAPEPEAPIVPAPVAPVAAPEPKPEPAIEAAPEPAPKIEAAPPPPPPAPPVAPPAPPAPPPPPVVIKRVNPKVRGSAAVGQASPETIAAIKRNLGQDSRSPARGASADGRPGARHPRSDRPDRPDRPSHDRPPRPAAKAGPTLEPVPPDADLTGKPRIKQRLKTKAKPSDMDDREVAEKKAKLAKRPKTKTEDWGIDDDSGYEDADTPLVPGDENAVVDGDVAAGLITQENEPVRSGFKHKRADFKSKRIQHELPASFAEIDNEFTRSIAGGGRRRGGRGARRNTGRRSRTRRIAGPTQRVAGQAAIVYLGMTLRDLSIALGVKLSSIMAYLLQAGQVAQVNDIVSEEMINDVANQFKIPLEWETGEDLEQELEEETKHQDELSDEGGLVERPPVVTFMGHVDHGKTSLLDCIRKTRVVDGEHGGITQHIGAYSVAHGDKRVTFLDTPGHEAFSAMRARGANLTDIAVLVVAADDGVMPQTEEAANHAKNAGVPIVVAINKCDLPSANPDRVRQELANRLGLLPEEWGGQVGMVQVSAHTKQGIEELVERILLEAEVLELRANPERPATGFVVEARMSEGQGVVATVLVSDGTLRVGDVILCSNGYGKIRFMFDEFGKPITEAGPGSPVRLSGLSAVPEAGDKFFILQDILKARAIAEQRERETRAAALARRQHVTLENLTTHLAGSGTRELRVIVKADVVGSLEVIEKTLGQLATSEVAISIIHSAVGGVNHADVILADASDAVILGFHVGVDAHARSQATNLGVQIRTYHIIYRMIEDMRAALEGLLPPEEKEVVQGHVEIRQVFRASKIGAIAGCYVTDGFVTRTSKIRLYRNQVVIYEGTLQSLKRVKDDAREVKSGFECGIKIANYDGIQEGDIIEAYTIEEIARKL